MPHGLPHVIVCGGYLLAKFPLFHEEGILESPLEQALPTANSVTFVFSTAPEFDWML